MTRIGVAKLARTLGVPVERLDYLAAVPDSEIKQFHTQVSRALLDANADRIERVARVSAGVPVSLMAKVAESSRSPLFAARFAGILDKSKAVGVAKRMPEPFLAAVAAELDPAEVRRIVGGLPPEVSVRIAVELARRQDWITLADTVAQLPRDTVAQSIPELDDVALLMSSSMVDDPDVLDMLAELTPADRIPGIVEATAERELWNEYRRLAKHFTDEQRVAAAAAAAIAHPAIAEPTEELP
jgi:hypothetical protein